MKEHIRFQLVNDLERLAKRHYASGALRSLIEIHLDCAIEEDARDCEEKDTTQQTLDLPV